MGREVGLLLICSTVLGNESVENRNGVLYDNIHIVRNSPLMGKNLIPIK